MTESAKQRIVPNLLAVDDEAGVLDSLKAVFEGDFNFVGAGTAGQALGVIQNQDIRVAIVDLSLPDMPGLTLLKKIKETTPDIECVVLTADTSLASGIEAMKLGAYDYIIKPFDVDRISLVVQNALEKTRLWQEVMHRRLNEQDAVQTLVGKSHQMKEIHKMIKSVCQNDATVLLTGESGTGKELVAQAIHSQSARRDAPFIAVNCGAIPEDLTESELFGHEKGAFTGAAQTKLGRFELAQHGTIFLDEVSTLPLNLQAKLLRVLQEKTLERVGGTKQIALDLRVIAATNRNLKELVADNNFREDLYYRLNVVPINLPPLRECKKDITLLTQHFLRIYNRKYKRNIKELPEMIMVCLMQYDWPGNIRELENIIQRLLVTAAGNTVHVEHLPIEIFGTGAGKGYLTLAEATTNFEKSYIQAILALSEDHQQDAAQILGIHRNTLSKRMKQYGLKEPPDENTAPPPPIH